MQMNEETVPLANWIFLLLLFLFLKHIPQNNFTFFRQFPTATLMPFGSWYIVLAAVAASAAAAAVVSRRLLFSLFLISFFFGFRVGRR